MICVSEASDRGRRLLHASRRRRLPGRKLLACVAMPALLGMALAACQPTGTQGTGTPSSTGGVGLTNWSQDPGLFATVSGNDSVVHAWGVRSTPGAWGTGPMNYESGATTTYNQPSSGSLSFDMYGTYCPGGVCSYGAGTGYQAFVQVWNDTGDYVAFGLIHDPAVSPTGTTIEVVGAAHGQPIGGFWPGGAVGGSDHHITVTWNSQGVQFNMDNNTTLGYYPVAITDPSISFIAAARMPGDTVDATFENIQFDTDAPVAIPAGNPTISVTTTMTESGSGSGYDSLLGLHDNQSGNAVDFGIQSDTTSNTSRGQPWFFWQDVSDGAFNYSYLSPAPLSSGTASAAVTISWWQNPGEAVFYANGKALAEVSLDLSGTLIVSVEGMAREEGDSVSDTFTNIDCTVPSTCIDPGPIGPWNLSYDYYGINATETGGSGYNDTSIAISGTATGVPSGDNWGSALPGPGVLGAEPMVATEVSV